MTATYIHCLKDAQTLKWYCSKIWWHLA